MQRIAVIGGGTMGHGIAQVAAAAGMDVTLYDLREDLVARALGAVEANFAKGVEKGKVTEAERDAALRRLKGSTSLEEAAHGADLVIEAVPEKLDLKRDLFAKLDALCPAHTILASNTSSLSITRLAEATRRPDRFLGLHFFNPVHIMKLLEIVVTDATSEETLATCREMAGRLDKEAIVVRDFPGFATSRLGVCLGLEAIRMIEQGVASPEDIDKALELGYRHPMGPLRLTDLVGLDVRLGIADYLHAELKSEVFKAPKLLREMVAQGKLGKKSGQGFYTW